MVDGVTMGVHQDEVNCLSICRRSDRLSRPERLLARQSEREVIVLIGRL